MTNAPGEERFPPALSEQPPSESLVRPLQARPRRTATRWRSRASRWEHRFYRFTRAGIALFLCVYFAVIVWRERIPGQGEVFPFASWSLFSLVPNAREDFALRLLAIDGKPLVPAPYFEEAKPLFLGATDHAASVAIDRLGKAVRAGDRLAAERLRRRFEAEYLRKQAQHVRYELVARTYDPMERWHSGTFRRVRTLTAYETGQP